MSDDKQKLGLKEKVTAELKNQPCAFCHEKKMILREAETDIPYFGKAFIFSMDCENCKYHKSDVELEKKEPVKWTLEVNGGDDMKIRIVKSSEATVKIPHIMNIEPGPASEGYVTNVEGLLNRVKDVLEGAKAAGSEEEEESDDNSKGQARKLIKKINRVLWGQEKLKIIIEDPSGNSAVISDKAVKGKI